jgi:hypothetical protein
MHAEVLTADERIESLAHVIARLRRAAGPLQRPFL